MMSPKEFLKQLVAGVLSATMLVGNVSVSMRLATVAGGLVTVLSLSRSAPAGARDYFAEGQSAGDEAFQAGKNRPAIDQDSFVVDIKTKDGKVHRLDMGAKPDGSRYKQSDLNDMRSSYGNQNNTDEKARAYDSENARFMRQTYQSHGHNSYRHDPAIASSNGALKTYEETDGFNRIMYGCENAKRSAPTDGTAEDPSKPNTETKQCFNIESIKTDECKIEHNVYLQPTNNTTTAVAIVLDRSGSMATNKRMDYAKEATTRLLEALQNAKWTRSGAFGFDASPYGTGLSDSADLDPTKFASRSFTIVGFNEYVNDPAPSGRMNQVSPSGGTPMASAMEDTAQRLANIAANRKIMLVVTDGEPTDDTSCKLTSSCTPQAVQSYWNSEIEFAAIGIELDSIRNYFDRYEIVDSPEDIAPAMFKILTERTDWFVPHDDWRPRTCIKVGEQIESGKYSGDIQCSDPADSNGCNIIDGLAVCRDSGYGAQLTPAPVGGYDGVCGEITISNISYCWKDSSGKEHCSDTTDESDLCDQYVESPYCAQKTSTCVESTRDAQGNCYVYEETYSCGHDADRPIYYESSKDPNCKPVQCTDGNCDGDTVEEQSTEFYMIATIMAMIQGSAQELEGCDDGDCQIFPGSEYWCVDREDYYVTGCCDEDTPELSFRDYMKVAQAMWNGFQEAGGMEWLQSAGVDIPGGWQYMKDGAAYVWDAVKQPFISAYDSIATSFAGKAAEEAGAAAADASSMFTTDALKDFIIDQIGRFLDKFFPDLAAQFFEQKATEAGTSYVLNEASAQVMQNVAQQVMGFVNAVMWIYMIYQMAMIADALISDCNGEFRGKNQMELRMKRDRMKLCHYVGTYVKRGGPFNMRKDERKSYCCFNSPLARILQEQIRKFDNLNISWGGKDWPDCRGITLEEISRVDWSKVDLAEWTQLMFEGGMIPEDYERDDWGSMNNMTTNKEDPDYWEPPNSDQRNQAWSDGEWAKKAENYQDQAWENKEDADLANKGSSN